MEVGFLVGGLRFVAIHLGIK